MSHSDVPTFACYGYPTGRLTLDFPDSFKARVRELAGEKGAPMQLRLVEDGQDKTRAQEMGFHAMVSPWAAHKGYSIDELKQWLLAEIFGTHFFPVPGTNDVIQVLAEPHTSKLTRRQYCTLIEESMRLAAERDDFYLVAPDEYRKAKEAAAKQAEREARRRAKAEAMIITCHHCKARVKQSEAVVREVEWEDGGQAGTEEIEVCASCAKRIDERQVA